MKILYIIKLKPYYFVLSFVAKFLNLKQWRLSESEGWLAILLKDDWGPIQTPRNYG